MKLRLLLTFFLICQSFIAFSETIIVTSNADAGVGTLRDAINKANSNGILEIDYIHFNLPGLTEGDRTILLETSLPSLTSKIVIDGTSQPSGNIGSSHARIIIKTFRSYGKPEIILFSAKDVEQLEFYGIYFYDTTNTILSNPGDVKRAIDIINGKNIVIGDLNKGNVFNGYVGYWGSIAIEKTDGLKIADNFLGVSPYAAQSVPTESIELKDVNNIEIGGLNKRNVVFTSFMLTLTDKSTIFNVNISNNNVLVHQDGVTTDWSSEGTLFRIYGSSVNNSYPQVNLNVSDNLFSHYSGTGAIELKQLGGFVKIWHNWFGVDRTGTIPLANQTPQGSSGYVLDVASITAEIIFGDEDPNLGNVVGYSSGIMAAFSIESLKIIRNSFRCLSGKAYEYGINNIPFVEVTESSSSYVKGKSTPLAIVDVFLSDDCKSCAAETFIGTTNASADGDWQFNLSSTYTRSILVNAHVGKQSSDFSIPIINATKIKITDVDCSTTGKITGIIINNTDKVKWVDEEGKTVSTEQELKHAIPGKYKLVIGEFCTTESEYFTIRDLSPIIFADNVSKKQPTCGLSDGSITNLFAYTADNSPITYLWTNQEAKVVANTSDITDLPSGSYTLTASSAKCFATYGPVILKSVNAPTIDLSGLANTASMCGQATGSISGINISTSGNVAYLWKNDKSEIVGEEKDLKNVSGGTYTLQITDDGGCGPVFSDPIVVTEINGITVDLRGLSFQEASCNTSDGSITGIVVTGATAHEWLDAGNTVVSNTVDLTGMPPGKYRLVSSNAFCSKTTDEFTIALAQSKKNYASTKVITNAQCNQNNGKIEVIFTIDQPAGFRWQDSSGQTVGSSRILADKFPGAYDLYITDELGCEDFIQQYIIPNTDGATINHAVESVTNDQCGLGKGRINAPGLTGGQQPYFYEWKDIDGNVVGSGAVLDKVKAGDYQLSIGDALVCSRQNFSYTVRDVSIGISVPVLNDVKICSAGKAVVQVMQAKEGIYAIYNESGSLIGKSSTGVFNIDVSHNQNFTIVLQHGNCESLPATVKVVIENDGIGKLANAFSPNGDSHNDDWLIPGIVNYPTAAVAIYNRYGVKVFESTGYKIPFNGRWNGSELPVGIYYYIIDLKRGCGLQKGSLTIVR